MAEEENKIILYTTDDGKSQVSLMSREGRVWLNQKQMAAFAVSGGRATALPGEAARAPFHRMAATSAASPVRRAR